MPEYIASILSRMQVGFENTADIKKPKADEWDTQHLPSHFTWTQSFLKKDALVWEDTGSKERPPN